MNIRVVIFLLTIFTVFVPCYSMQVANTTVANNIIVTQTKKVELKKNKVKKSRKIWGILLFVLGIGLVMANTVFVASSITTLNIILASLGLGITIFGDRIIRKHEPLTKEEDKINHDENLSSLLVRIVGFVAAVGLLAVFGAFLISVAGSINYMVLSIFYLAVGLAFLVNAVLKKKNKNKIWGTILIYLGIFTLAHGAFLSFMWLILAIFSPPQATGLLFGVALFLSLLSLTSVFFGYKLVQKGRKEEQEKKQKRT